MISGVLKREWQTGTDCTWFVMRRICLIIHSIIGILILIIIVKLCNPGISSWVHILVVYQQLTSKVHLIHVHQAQFVYTISTMSHKCSSFSHTHWCLISYANTLFIHVHCITYWTVLINCLIPHGHYYKAHLATNSTMISNAHTLLKSHHYTPTCFAISVCMTGCHHWPFMYN